MSLERSLEDLTGTTRVLDAELQPLEDRFRVVAERLTEGIGVLRSLSSAFDALPLGLEGEDVAHATHDMEDMARRLGAIAAGMDRDQGTLDGLTGQVGTVVGRVTRLGKTVSVFTVLAINARIAAAHVSNVDVDFSVFTSEIGRLARMAASTIGHFDQDLRRLADRLDTANRGQRAFAGEHRQTLQSVAGHLQQSLGSVSSHRRQAAKAATTISHTSRDLMQRIGDAVGALQIGDITRQRVEHVAHAVQTLVNGFSPGGEEWAQTMGGHEREQLIATVCRLQSVQLTHALADFNRDVERAAVALRAMTGDVRGLLDTGRNSYGVAGHSGESFLIALAREMKEAGQLMERYCLSRQQVDEAVTSVSQSLTGLVKEVESVRAIETDMRLIGLNTALKCGRLGTQGRALSVIAQELRALANRTVEDSRHVSDGLEAIVAAAQALARQDGEREGDQGGDAFAVMARTMAGSVVVLERVGGAMSEALAALERDGARVFGLLDAAASGLAVQQEVGQGLGQVIGVLDRIANSVDVGPADIPRIKELVLSLMKGRYTMESERMVHEMFAETESGTAIGAAPAVPAGASAGASLDDILF
jgi:methyl-accepting chemotaxis protein